MWNLSNKLTMVRIALVPVFVLVLLLVPAPLGNYIALFVFAAASFTDYLDGHLARKHGWVTNFGKFIDPLADKLLVTTALILLCERGNLAGWIVVILIARDFVISGFRLLASDQGVVIAAHFWGKAKTVCQMIMIMLMILNIDALWYQILTQIFVAASLVTAIISLADYFLTNKDILKEGK